MSLYNAIHGTTSATFFVLPMLGKHPNQYPRFRDCFTDDEENPQYKDHIHIYTRTGGGNREGYAEENQQIRDMNGFVTDFDDSFDSTFASWIFKVPEKWENDFKAFSEGKLKNISKEYRLQLDSVFPKLKDKFKEMFTLADNKQSNKKKETQ